MRDLRIYPLKAVYNADLANEADLIVKIQEDTTHILKLAMRSPFKQVGFGDYVSQARLPKERRPLLERVLKSDRYKRYDHTSTWLKKINDFATSTVTFQKDGHVHVTIASVSKGGTRKEWFQYLTPYYQRKFLAANPSSKFQEGPHESDQLDHAGLVSSIEELDRERTGLKYMHGRAFANLQYARHALGLINSKPGVRTPDMLVEIAKNSATIKRYENYPAIKRVAEIDAERHAKRYALDVIERLHAAENTALKRMLSDRERAECDWLCGRTAAERTKGRDDYQRLTKEIAHEISKIKE